MSSLRNLFVCLMMMVGLRLYGAPLIRNLPTPRIFSQGDGLPVPSINSLAKDASGRIWAGTQHGLAYFAGSRWAFLPGPEGDARPFIQCMLPTPEGLYVGCYGQGLMRWDGRAWRRWFTVNGVTLGRVISLMRTPDGSVWVGYESQGLWRLKDNVLTQDPAFEGQLIGAMACEGDLLLAGTGLGVFRSKGGGPWTQDEGGPERANAILRFRDQWWIGGDGGIFTFGQGRWQKVPGMESFRVLRLYAGPGGNGRETLWAATNRGVLRQEAGQWVQLQFGQEDPSFYASELLFTEAPRGSPQIWVASFNGVMRSLLLGGWQAVGKEGGEQPAFAAFEDPDGVLWVGDSSGVLRWKRGDRWDRLANIEGKGLGIIVGFAPLRRSGGKWDLALSSIRGGLALRRQGRWQWVSPPGLPKEAEVVPLAEGRLEGRVGLWLGTSQGVFFWDGEQPVRRLSGPGIGGPIQARQLCAVPGPAEELWATGPGEGLWRWKNQAWQEVAPWRRSGYPGPIVWVEGPAGPRLLLGGMEGGLMELDPAHPERPSRVWDPERVPGYPDGASVGMVRDPQGRTWVLTGKGVVCLDAEGRVLQTYDPEDGLPAKDGAMNSMVLDRQGRLWVSTTKGLASLDLSTVRLPEIPELRFVQAHGASGPLLPDIALPHGIRNLTFSLALFTHHRERDVRYRFQLTGLDDAPGPWGEASSVAYAVLPSGSYRLLAWGLDPHGREIGPVAFSFTVKPPIWRHPAALVGYVLLLAGLGWSTLVWRTASLRTLNRRLERAVAEATEDLRSHEVELMKLNQRLYELNDTKNRLIGIAAHDLRNPLTGILLQCDALDLTDPSPDRSKSIDNLRRQAQQMQGLIQRLLDVHAIEAGQAEDPHPEPVDLMDLTEDILATFRLRAEQKGILLVNALREEPRRRVFADPGLLRQVIENLLSNALKFSPPGGKVRIRMEPDPDAQHRVLVVEDEGPGIAPEDRHRLFNPYARLSAVPTGGETSVGLGLSIVKRIVESMGGRVWEGGDAQGAAFHVSLPSA